MSAYDDAVEYLDAEVYPRCDYDIYSGMWDIVDEMEAENAKLRDLVLNMWDVALHPQLFGDGSHLLKRMRELGIEVEE